MIIFIDTFNNSIKTFRAETKKETPFFYEQEFDFDLSLLDNKLKAVSLFTGSEGGAELKKSHGNQLILSDDVLALGVFPLKYVGRQKYQDVFRTQLGIHYPKTDVNYYYDGYEYDRDDKFVYYNYEIAKRETINQIASIFKNSGISIGDRNVFATNFTITDKNVAPYPIPVLIVGKYNSEFIICKGSKVLSINIFGYGSELMLNGDINMDSSYNLNNERALKFATLIKNHIVNDEEVNETNINNSDPSKSLTYPEARELRLLRVPGKEDKLQAYNIHNNFRKFYARLTEITEYYSKSPWFFPLREISVIASSEVMSYLLDVVREDDAIRFVALCKSVNEVAERGITNNPMYQKGVKKERRQFDWKAILNTEIGGKKKKA